MRRGLGAAVCLSLFAYAATAFACPPSPSLVMVPLELLTDLSRPIARDQGIVFAGETQAAPPMEPGFVVEVSDVATGESVPGHVSYLEVYLLEKKLTWLPQQPMAANTNYALTVKPLPTTTPGRPPVASMQARFTTGAERLPEIEFLGEPRLSLRIATGLPLRCTGPCAGMSGPCFEKPLLFADVEIPPIQGGSAADGYKVHASIRFNGTEQLDGDERTGLATARAGTTTQTSIELPESPEPFAFCYDLTAHDYANHATKSDTFCVDAQTVAEVFYPTARTLPVARRNADVTKHAKACASAAPGKAAGAPGWLALAGLLALLALGVRRRCRR